ncbi:hypothetical protein N7516_005898 [Penicillium verrucosum]|uniref:uncharacterized protein n=1 Tax=Penicillium verrucosum TaxID=60171 RepID=UPI002545070E|nr:uncharacterized protein N7516_005898 [Penicillium verrucosum]KAJ5931409.1 hypothetical protein N7516_005898 [Penicillium verrucosum]
MSILATSAGVKRLFNSTRDICHYRRGSLSLETIQQEIAATSEELYIKTHYAEAISDTKEDIEIHLDTPAVALLLAVAAGKRPAINSDDKEDPDTDDITDLEETSELPLPNTQQRDYITSEKRGENCPSSVSIERNARIGTVRRVDKVTTENEAS